MPLIDPDAPISPSMRRWFGLSLATLLGLLAYWLSRQGLALPARLLAAASVTVGVCYYAIQSSREPLIRGWLRLTHPLAWVVGHGLLATIYFCLVTPLGWWLRWRGYDPLLRKGESASSYWRARGESAPAEQYFRQF
jgi:hypothetical protein